MVIWPDDKYQKLVNVKSNQTLKVSQIDATATWVYDTNAHSEKSLLVQETLPGIRHHENTFSDFNVQGLLPNYLSREGPCIEVADINKDGLQDFFMSGAKNKPSRIFTQNTNGTFSSKRTP